MYEIKFAKRFIRHVLCDRFKIPHRAVFLPVAYTQFLARAVLNRPILKNRDYLPPFLKLLNLNGRGVEIGVAIGEFSELLLKYSDLAVLYSVDPWKEFDKDTYDDLTNVRQDEFEKRYKLAIERLSKYKERSKILRMTSQEACGLFTPESLDIVYIDANHSYEQSKKDVELWWPKLRNGGIFAGHDYLNGNFPAGAFGVKKVVDEFADRLRQKVFVTFEEWPTWYLIKNTKLSRTYIVDHLLRRISAKFKFS
jgi:predicted O-methyltransferase YrrM